VCRSAAASNDRFDGLPRHLPRTVSAIGQVWREDEETYCRYEQGEARESAARGAGCSTLSSAPFGFMWRASRRRLHATCPVARGAGGITVILDLRLRDLTVQRTFVEMR
jgi:hypothetical protein